MIWVIIIGIVLLIWESSVSNKRFKYLQNLLEEKESRISELEEYKEFLEDERGLKPFYGDNEPSLS